MQEGLFAKEAKIKKLEEIDDRGWREADEVFESLGLPFRVDTPIEEFKRICAHKTD